jgi:hypothetical protein
MKTSYLTTLPLCAALVCTSGVAASAPSARLVYSRSVGAESCPDEAALKRAVAARIGYDAFFPWAALTIIVRFARAHDGDAFVASVEMVDSDAHSQGARELRAPNCTALVDAAALTISIAIDPQSLAGPVQHVEVVKPDPPPTLEPPIQREAEHAEVARPTPSTPPKESTRWSFVLSPLVGAGRSVSPAFGASLRIAARTTWWSVGAEGRFDVPVSANAEGGGRIGSWLATGSVLPCTHFGPTFACAVFELGVMRASGFDVLQANTASSLWFAAGGRFGVERALSTRVFAGVHSDLLANLHRTTLRLNGFEAWVAPVLSATLGFDMGVRF